MDPITLTDDELARLDLTGNTVEAVDAVRVLSIDEQERRQRIAQAPTDIRAAIERYVQDGGNPEAIRAALTEALPAETPATAE